MEDAVGARTKFKRLIEVDSMHEAPLQRPKKGRNTKQHSSFEIQEEGHNSDINDIEFDTSHEFSDAEKSDRDGDASKAKDLAELINSLRFQRGVPKSFNDMSQAEKSNFIAINHDPKTIRVFL